MANNPKKGPFDLSIDLDKVPGYRARFGTVDPNGDVINPELTRVSTKEAQDADPDLRRKFASGQDIRSNPTTILRRKGLRVR